MTVTEPFDLQPFHAMEILGEAKALEAEGRSILHLEVGEPGVPAAPGVREAVLASLDMPQRYTHSKGTIELRRRLAKRYLTDHGVEVDPERIIVTMGSSSGFILSFLAAYRPGARIAVTRPGYPAYLNILSALGFTPVEIALSPSNGWKLTPDALRSAHAREPLDGLLFASPANPTGAAVSPEELAELVHTCEELGIQLVSDEIYHGLDYVNRSASALETGTGAIIVNSFSKYHCMTGWRIGWLVMPDRFMRKTEILQQNLFISAPSLSQTAALAALDETAYAEAQTAHYAANRLRLADGLNALGLDVALGEGAFYAYADISRHANDSFAFCKALLREAGVAATPGIDFDRENGHRFVRFSYAGDERTIGDALDRLSDFLKS